MSYPEIIFIAGRNNRSRLLQRIEIITIFIINKNPQKGLEKAPPPDLYPPLKAAFHMASPLVKRGL